MHVEIETQPQCIAVLNIEVPADRVQKEREGVINAYAKSVRLPGYRPGKVPRTMVQSKFKEDIANELKHRLANEAVREAIKEKNLRVLQVADVDEVVVGEDDKARFSARLILNPEFELPEYKGIALKVPADAVEEKEIDLSIDRLRGQLATFEDITDRGLEMGDFAVVDYKAQLDGQPLEDILRVPKELSGREGFWIKMAPEVLIPSFCEGLVGLKQDESKELTLKVPKDFPIADLQEKTLTYQVTVKGLKKQILPELNDEFAAQLMPGKTLEDLRANFRTRLEQERKNTIEHIKRQQATKYLQDHVDFELPAEYVRNETRRIMDDVVNENQNRGVSDEEIQSHEKDIVGTAGKAARERLKTAFILSRIAEKESIKVTNQDFNSHLDAMASHYNMTRDKVLEQLRKHNALDRVAEDILLGKSLAFVISNAQVETTTLTPEALLETVA